MKTREMIYRIEQIDTPEHRTRILAQLTSHIGQANAIGMAPLYEAVFGRPWQHRINDTRALRRLVTILREEGVPICSVASHDGGYYLAAAGSELSHYLRRNERRALLILTRNARIKKVALPNYLGQIRMEMGETGG